MKNLHLVSLCSMMLVSCMTVPQMEPIDSGSSLVVARVRVAAGNAKVDRISAVAQNAASGETVEFVGRDEFVLSDGLSPGPWVLESVSYSFGMWLTTGVEYDIGISPTTGKVRQSTTPQREFVRNDRREDVQIEFTVEPGKVINLGAIGLNPRIAVFSFEDPLQSGVQVQRAVDVKSTDSQDVERLGEHANVRYRFSEQFPRSQWLDRDWVEVPIND